MYEGTEAATGSLLQKKVFLKFSPNSQENTCVCRSLLFDKVEGLMPVTLPKKKIFL